MERSMYQITYCDRAIDCWVTDAFVYEDREEAEKYIEEYCPEDEFLTEIETVTVFLKKED